MVSSPYHLPSTLTAHPSPFPTTQYPYNLSPGTITQPEDPLQCKAGSYKFQLDEQWFNLTQDTLRDALQITPVDKNRAFSSPPTPDTLVEFVNKLGYPKETSGLKGREPPSTNPLGFSIKHTSNYSERHVKNLLTSTPHTFASRQKEVAQHNSGGRRKHSYPYPVSGRLKFSAKGANEKILDDKPNDSSMIPKPTKQAKPKATEQPIISKTKAKKSKLAPAKPKEKKRKPVSESYEAQPLAKRAKAGKVAKKRTVKSSKQLVDEFVDEGVPAAKPSLEDIEEAILQKVLQESLTDATQLKGKGNEESSERTHAQVLLQPSNSQEEELE
ncbi:hypothetical protein Tco_0974429 [Tanacetum coccineum]|uniref:Uncharacterized protein n=1 Tax=Tanacetum coccineum TaxID=301880 RepID=A0ABQ5EBP7_9ASTR